jgi:hypothetical protein
MFQYHNMRFHWTFRQDEVIGPIVFKIDRSDKFQK